DFWCSPMPPGVDSWRPAIVSLWWPLGRLGGLGEIGEPAELAALPFRLLSLGLHLLVTWRVWVLATDLRWPRPAALASTLWFALMPIHSEVVATAIGAAESAATLCVLLA